MRDDDKRPLSEFPAAFGGRYRICPVCSRGFGGRPKEQRCCSTRCAAELRRKASSTEKTPRFNIIKDRGAEVTDGGPDLAISDQSWGERGNYWESVADACTSRERYPSIGVTGHGALLRVHGNELVIRHGFTHHPQRRREIRFRPRDPKLPARIVLINCDGAVTIPAMAWLSRQQIPLVLLNTRGYLTASLLHTPEHEPNEARKRLQNARPELALALARKILFTKLTRQLSTISLFPHSALRERAALHIRRERELLSSAVTIDDALIIEARAAVAYFKLWARLPMKWKGLARRPIPPEWFYIGLRGSTVGTTNRHSSHPAQAMINYVHGILESQVARACALLGLGTTAGIIHARRLERPSLVLDLMELLVPDAEARLLEFIRGQMFSRADFPIGDDGVVRLHPQLARVVSALKLNDNAVRKSVESFVVGLFEAGDSTATASRTSYRRSISTSE